MFCYEDLSISFDVGICAEFLFSVAIEVELLGYTMCCVQLYEVLPAVYKSSDWSTSLLALTIVCH